jgi:hypothetical protein
MITGEWNSQEEGQHTQHDPGNVENPMKENEMIPGPWWQE